MKDQLPWMGPVLGRHFSLKLQTGLFEADTTFLACGKKGLEGWQSVFQPKMLFSIPVVLSTAMWPGI